MSGSLVLVHLAGAVALLLFSTRMVRTGVERAYGDRLRLRLRAVLGNPVMAVATGTLLAICLQSATAVVMLVGSFSGAGMVSAASGLVAVLGADLGSALVVKLLSFDVHILVPIFLASGTAMFMATERREWRQPGRILVGIGLLLLSLRMIGEASEPLRESRLLPVIVNYLSGDPVTAFLIAGVMTWLFHSSVAAVLLVTALAARGLLPGQLGLVLVLGVNAGAGLIAFMLSRGALPRARLVPTGNLILRLGMAVLALAAIGFLEPDLSLLGTTAAAQVVHGHIAFNALIVLLGATLAPWVIALAEKLVMRPSSAATPASEGEISALDESALTTPGLALANATREVVRMCETVELMLTRVIELYEDADQERIDALSALDDRVDKRHRLLKLYLARATAAEMTDDQRARARELLGACVKLEQVGDIVVRNLLPQVQKKLDRHVAFTSQGWRELASFHAAVLANARLAFNVLISRDTETAREIVRQKDRLRDQEKQSSSSHFERLREGREQSLDTSTLHLDTIRDLKQINSLLASIAYPVLEDAGLLKGSRLSA